MASLTALLIIASALVAILSARLLMALSIEQFARERSRCPDAVGAAGAPSDAFADDESLPIKLGAVWRRFAARGELRRLALLLAGLMLYVLLPVGVVITGLVAPARKFGPA
ncbi:hypothetical protein ACXIUS_20105 [Bosea thiooxidans]